MRKIIVGKSRLRLKPHPLSPSPFRGGGTFHCARNLQKLRFRWKCQLVGFRSPVPEREGGQGEGFPLPTNALRILSTLRKRPRFIRRFGGDAAIRDSHAVPDRLAYALICPDWGHRPRLYNRRRNTAVRRRDRTVPDWVRLAPRPAGWPADTAFRSRRKTPVSVPPWRT